MFEVRTNTVVVGIDGSPAALDAARWAADQAHERGATLTLVHGFVVPAAAYPDAQIGLPELRAALEQQGRAHLAIAAQRVRTVHPDLPVTSICRQDHPVSVLRSAAAHALFTVVGAHGHHSFPESLMGSIARQVAGHLPGAVVVVRPDPAVDAVRAAGPVLVGLDGSRTADAALAFALEEASLRRVPLIAAHSWLDWSQWYALAQGIPVTQTHLADRETRVLAEQLAGWAQKYPDVVVHRVVRPGDPVPTLIELARDSTAGLPVPSLLVVGTRGRGGFSGLLLGSTSQSLVAHAPCPVAVVPADRQ